MQTHTKMVFGGKSAGNSALFNYILFLRVYVFFSSHFSWRNIVAPSGTFDGHSSSPQICRRMSLISHCRRTSACCQPHVAVSQSCDISVFGLSVHDVFTSFTDGNG